MKRPWGKSVFGINCHFLLKSITFTQAEYLLFVRLSTETKLEIQVDDTFGVDNM